MSAPDWLMGAPMDPPKSPLRGRLRRQSSLDADILTNDRREQTMARKARLSTKLFKAARVLDDVEAVEL